MNDKQQNIPQSSSSKGAERPNAVCIEENITQHVERLKRIRKQMMELRIAFSNKIDRIFDTREQGKHPLKDE
jgi:hypothetical protein